MPRWFVNNLVIIGVVSALSCSTAKVQGDDCPTAAQVQAGVRIECGGNEIVGTMAGGAGVAACTQDGQTGCLTTAAFAAAATAGLAAKIPKGQTVAGVAGEAAIATAAACTSTGETNCEAVAAFPAIDQSVLAQCLGTSTSTSTAALTAADDAWSLWLYEEAAVRSASAADCRDAAGRCVLFYRGALWHPAAQAGDCASLSLAGRAWRAAPEEAFGAIAPLCYARLDGSANLGD